MSRKERRRRAALQKQSPVTILTNPIPSRSCSPLCTPCHISPSPSTTAVVLWSQSFLPRWLPRSRPWYRWLATSAKRSAICGSASHSFLWHRLVPITLLSATGVDIFILWWRVVGDAFIAWLPLAAYHLQTHRRHFISTNSRRQH